jgi:hypothetical protein
METGSQDSHGWFFKHRISSNSFTHNKNSRIGRELAMLCEQSFTLSCSPYSALRER